MTQRKSIILLQSSFETESDDLVYTTYNKILKKTNYGDSLETLNVYERTLYITQILEGEVNNGGFSQFFSNSSGDLSNEIVDAFQAIGALRTAEICKEALSIFPDEIPIDRMQREDLLSSLNWDTIDDILETCDRAFYDYEDNLQELNLSYIIKNRTYFD